MVTAYLIQILVWLIFMTWIHGIFMIYATWKNEKLEVIRSEEEVNRDWHN